MKEVELRLVTNGTQEGTYFIEKDTGAVLLWFGDVNAAVHAETLVLRGGFAIPLDQIGMAPDDLNRDLRLVKGGRISEDRTVYDAAEPRQAFG